MKRIFNMEYTKQKDAEIGDEVFVPINGEHMQEEQICQSYTVVKALKCNTSQLEQIVATGEQPMPILMELTDETGFKK